jgi:hypothetical protein
MPDIRKLRKREIKIFLDWTFATKRDDYSPFRT